MGPTDRFDVAMSDAVVLSGTLMIVLMLVFAAFYSVRFFWEKYPIGRAIVAAVFGMLVEALGDLAHNIHWQELGDILTIVGNVWLSVLFAIIVGFTARGSMAGVVEDLPPLETRPKPGEAV